MRILEDLDDCRCVLCSNDLVIQRIPHEEHVCVFHAVGEGQFLLQDMDGCRVIAGPDHVAQPVAVDDMF